jgi:hypothetical protein
MSFRFSLKPSSNLIKESTEDSMSRDASVRSESWSHRYHIFDPTRFTPHLLGDDAGGTSSRGREMRLHRTMNRTHLLAALYCSLASSPGASLSRRAVSFRWASSAFSGPTEEGQFDRDRTAAHGGCLSMIVFWSGYCN